MGGTFDPIHHGHLVAASEVAGLFGLDEVVFVPTGQPWQKTERAVSPPEDRYLMTVIATASNPRFSVSRVDIDRGGPTYTIDTLTDLRQLRPDAELFFITGADALAQIVSWRDNQQLFDLAHFIGVTRPGFHLADAHLPEGVVSLVEVPALAISSTDCRDRVGRGMPVWYLVPDGVVQYIEKRGLYREVPRRRRPPTAIRPPTRTSAHDPPPGGTPMTASAEARDTALLAAQAAADKLATDVSIVDVSDRLAITDAFVLASAPNERQVQSIVDEVEERLRGHGIKPVRREGVAESRWVLLDFVDVVVHVQHAEERAYYALERLWKDCPTIPFADSTTRAGRPSAPDARRVRRRPAGDRPGAARAGRSAAGAVAARPDRVERHRSLPGPARPAPGRGGPQPGGPRRAAPRRRRACRRTTPSSCPATSSRAAETAATLTDLLGVPLRLDARLREHGMGSLGGPDPRRGGRAVPRAVRRLDRRAGRCAAGAGRSPPPSPTGRWPRWSTCRRRRSPSSSPTAAPPGG